MRGEGRVQALGTHLLVELHKCNPALLNDATKVEQLMVAAANTAGATIVDTHFHQFNPIGVSGMVVITESHLAIHTWPEFEYAAVDIFTCGDMLKPKQVAQQLIEAFESQQPTLYEVKRGCVPLTGVYSYGQPQELQMVP